MKISAKKAVSRMILTIIFLVGMLTSAFNTQLVKASGTIYIRADGSIDPPTASISTVDNVNYTFTDNVYDEIVIEKSNIIVNGKGYTLQGSGGGDGFYLRLINNVTIQNTNIKNYRNGVHLFESYHDSISGNNITDNESGVFLVELGDWWLPNIVYGNNITGNDFGIILSHSRSQNSIYGNTIANNLYGVTLSHTSNSKFYHNNFIDNTRAQVSTIDNYPNTWDDGYPSGGNYWSDYNGVDLYSGPYQNETGSDGIGDTPYTLTERDDHYPLMNPYPPLRDIATMNVTPSKTVVGQGFSATINVTVENQGDMPETFEVTTCYNDTSIETKTIANLSSGEETTVTFTWNTTGIAKGNYTISAYVDPVPGETDTFDNILVNGDVMVTIPGDVNGDRTVDIFDIGYISAHWFPGPPIGPLGYDASADVNGDGNVDIFDIGITSAHWGQSW